MGAADRLHTPTTGVDVGPIAPSDTARGDKTGLYDTGVNPADTKSAIRPSADVVYDGSDLRDLRSLGGNDRGRVVFVNSDAAGADTFTLSFTCDVDAIPGYVAGTADTDGVFTTSALDDDASAATIQTAIRAALPGTDLTVVEGDGPDFYIIFDRKFWPRRYPLVSFNGTGCTATITTPTDANQDARGAVLTAARDGEISFLGESGKVTDADSILRPTIGTITVTPGVDKVDTLSFSAGTDGGTYELGTKNGHRVFEWDDSVVAVRTALRELYGNTLGSGVADAPTIRWVTPLSAEIVFTATTDFGTGDTAVLTYDNTVDDPQDSDALTFAALDAGASAAARGTIVADWVKTIDAFSGLDVVATEVTENVEYDVVFHTSPRGLAVTQLALAVTGGGDEDATPDANTALSEEAGFTFTYENGKNAGRVNVDRVVVKADALTDGGVAEPATLTATTAGVLGSASAAYTENGTGDSVLGAAVNDATGESYGFVGDAASPLAFTGLPPGVYHCVLRTVEDGRVSKADSKAFTMTSA